MGDLTVGLSVSVHLVHEAVAITMDVKHRVLLLWGRAIQSVRGEGREGRRVYY